MGLGILLKGRKIDEEKLEKNNFVRIIAKILKIVYNVIEIKNKKFESTAFKNVS